MAGVGRQEHGCGLTGDQGLHCLPDEQIIPILLQMDPDTLLNSGRSSDRLLRLVCDRVVWLHLLKQTTDFSKEALEVLVDFVPENRRSELMPEVLRAAAMRFPSFEVEGKNPFKIIWTLQGWAAPETLLYFDFNNLKEFTDVAKAVRTTPTILEVQGLSSLVSLKNLKRITDLVEQQGEKLASCEWTGLDLYVNTDEFFVLQRMSIKWKASRLKVSVGGGWNRKLAEFAGSSLDNGHIGSLVVTWYQEQGAVNLTALKRVWEIADEMRIHKNRFDLLLNVGGGRGEDREEAWQLVLNLFLP